MSLGCKLSLHISLVYIVCTRGPLEQIQQDLFENITDKLIEWLDVTRGFWKYGRGVKYETTGRGKSKMLRAVIRTGTGKTKRLPLAHVRLVSEIQNKKTV